MLTTSTVTGTEVKIKEVLNSAKCLIHYNSPLLNLSESAARDYMDNIVSFLEDGKIDNKAKLIIIDEVLTQLSSIPNRLKIGQAVNQVKAVTSLNSSSPQGVFSNDQCTLKRVSDLIKEAEISVQC